MVRDGCLREVDVDIERCQARQLEPEGAVCRAGVEDSAAGRRRSLQEDVLPP